MHVIHKIESVWNSQSKILILGTMPSPSSRSAGFFYMHPQNRFWPVMEKVFDVKFNFPNSTENKESAIKERFEFLLEHKIALWDVLAGCEIEGAKDSSIKNAVPNDFSGILSSSKIEKIFCTGKKSFSLYEKLCSQKYSVPYDVLPSTSPANAVWTLENLAKEYELKLKAFL